MRLSTPGITVALAVALLAMSPASLAKPAKGTLITEADLRVCAGFAGADPQTQIATCTKIINSGKVKHPHESEYYAYRAGAYLAIKQASAAVADMDKAIALVDKPEYRFQRALSLLADNQFDETISDLNQVTKVKPDFAPAWFMRGVIFYRRSEYARAVSEFDKAATLIPTYYQAIFARGAAKLKLDDAGDGRADIKSARGMSSHADEDMKKLGILAPG